MDINLAAPDMAGNLGNNVDDYDWHEEPLGSSREGDAQTPEARGVSPKTFEGTY